MYAFMIYLYIVGGLMKKGFSLVEIIISVGLIAIVMLFLFQILTDLQYEESASNYASSNQLNRANVIQKVEEDFNTRFIKSVRTKQIIVA